MQFPASPARKPRSTTNLLGLIAKISALLCIASVAIAFGLERPHLQAAAKRAAVTSTAPGTSAAEPAAATGQPYRGT